MAKPPSLSVISNNSGLLIQNSCTRTEYLCGSPYYVWKTVERESNPTKSHPFSSCITVTLFARFIPRDADTYMSRGTRGYGKLLL